jgi:hypothetical protein
MGAVRAPGHARDPVRSAHERASFVRFLGWPRRWRRLGGKILRLSFRRLGPFLPFFVGSVVALACGGADDTNFGTDDGSGGDPAGNGGSAQGGSSTQGGSTQGGSTQGGSSGTASGSGGSDQGGNATGGSSGAASGGATTGGAGGTDGGSGAGGTLGGTGPGGSGGASGRAGSGGKGGDDCAAIIANAQAALLAAQVCNPALSTPKCAGTVEDLCGCSVPVDDPESTATKSYLAQREAAVRCGVPCLLIPCREPTSPMCGFSGATTRIIVAPSHCTWSPR